jgi:hypothetical protein
MKSIYDTLVGKNIEDLHPQEEFETLECPENQTIIQIHRKIKLLNEFKKYIEYADQNTVYYRYIINTQIYERRGTNAETYIITQSLLGKIFGGLCEWRIM